MKIGKRIRRKRERSSKPEAIRNVSVVLITHRREDQGVPLQSESKSQSLLPNKTNLRIVSHKLNQIASLPLPRGPALKLTQRRKIEGNLRR